MKRFIIYMIMLSSFPILMQGQIKFGVKAGVNVADLTFDSDVFAKENITGFSGGLALDANIPVIGLSISSGLLYTQRGASIEGDNVKIGYLDIPAFLKWNIKVPLTPVGVYFQGGPYFSLAVDDKDAEKMKDYFGDFNNFDVGLGLGAGVSLFSKLEVGAYYTWGLTDAYKIDNVKNRGWNITATYFF